MRARRSPDSREHAFLTDEQLHAQATRLSKSGYGAYLLEILKYIPTDEVKLTFRAPERAATLEPEGWNDPALYLCLVMSLRLVD